MVDPNGRGVYTHPADDPMAGSQFPPPTHADQIPPGSSNAIKFSHAMSPDILALCSGVRVYPEMLPPEATSSNDVRHVAQGYSLPIHGFKSPEVTFGIGIPYQQVPNTEFPSVGRNTAGCENRYSRDGWG